MSNHPHQSDSLNFFLIIWYQDSNREDFVSFDTFPPGVCPATALEQSGRVLAWCGPFYCCSFPTTMLFNPSQFSPSMAPLLHQLQLRPMPTLSTIWTFLTSSFSAHLWSRQGLIMLASMWSVERALGSGCQPSSRNSQTKHGCSSGGMSQGIG